MERQNRDGFKRPLNWYRSCDHRASHTANVFGQITADPHLLDRNDAQQDEMLQHMNWYTSVRFSSPSVGSLHLRSWLVFSMSKNLYRICISKDN